MPLSADMERLRQRMAAPGDELYKHLTELMEALDEVTEESATSPGGSLPPMPASPGHGPGPARAHTDARPQPRRRVRPPPHPLPGAVLKGEHSLQLKRRRSLRTLSETAGGGGGLASSLERLSKSKRRPSDSSPSASRSHHRPPPGGPPPAAARNVFTTPEGTGDPGSDSDTCGRQPASKSPGKGSPLKPSHCVRVWTRGAYPKCRSRAANERDKT